MSDTNPTFLEVEDDEQRQDRISTILERLNTTSPAISALRPILPIEHEVPIEPPTELLARVEAFLPAISASNAALAQQRPEDINIEHIQMDEKQYIEMPTQNLGLGVFEAKPRPESTPRSASPCSDVEPRLDTSSSSESDSESFRSNSDSEDTDSGSDDDEDDSYDSDSESQSGSSIDLKPVFSRPIKPLPRRVSQQANTMVASCDA